MFKSTVINSIMVGLLAASASAAAATSGSVTLGGTVTSTLAITSTSTAGASTLDLSTGEKIVKVADISMITNNEQGLTLTASSGNLTKTGGTSLAYQVTSVNDGAAPPDNTAFPVASGSNYVFTTSAAGPAAEDLYIMYNPATYQDPGAYSATITLTVTDR